MVNLKGHLPAKGLDDTYIMLIPQANLDEMGGRAVATIHRHAAALKRSIYNCQLFRKTPTIPPRGPMPLIDTVGMGLAVELLFHSLNAVPRIKGKSHIQFDSMRQPRATFTLAWESSPIGIQEGSTFTLNMARVTITSCPTQQKWFERMMRGAKSRMGYTTQQQQPLGTNLIVKLLDLIREETKEQDQSIAGEFFKVGAGIATAICASLRGSEVFMMELAALRKHIHLGKGGIIPMDPMKAGTELSTAPHAIITLLGEYKGELDKYLLMSLASTTTLGIEVRWWIETLIRIREEEGCITGPAFGHKDSSVALMRE
jgi:hypothetical protein